jgi:hypothetical protein
MLVQAEVEQQRLRSKEKRRTLMERLMQMPDFTMNIK